MNYDIQFVVTCEFDAQIANEQKDKFIEVSEAETQEVKKNPKDYLVSAKAVKPAENVLISNEERNQACLLPKVDQ